MIGNNLLMAGDEGYNLTRSLRTRASASAYLNRTFTTPTDGKKFTWSGWIKKGDVRTGATGGSYLLSIPYSTGAVALAASINGSNQLGYINWDGSTVYHYVYTNGEWRDPAHWYHVIFSFDSTQGTAANRLQIYVNGLLQPLTVSNAIGLNDASLNNSGTRNFCYAQGASSKYFDGYLAEVNFIDGQALTPSSFGSYNSTTGVWQPAKYTGTYGTNGFYLPFTDNSALTTGSNVGLGKDFSGNGNYWVTNNISITAGVTYDSMTDVPTLTSATAANFAVLNPLAVTASAPASITDGNLKAFTPSVGGGNTYASIAIPSSGKYYWEVTLGTGNNPLIGVSSYNPAETYLFNNTNAVQYLGNGQKYVDGTGTAYGATFTTNDVIGVAVDSAGSITFYKNNVSQGAISHAMTGLFPVFSDAASGSGDIAYFNFGQRPFTYTPPSGFVALNSFNIPEGSITTSGSFTGNVSADGPSIYLNGVPTAMTINGNAVTMGTHADKTAYGFKVRSSSTSYNSTGTNTYSITTTGTKFKYANAQGNP